MSLHSVRVHAWFFLVDKHAWTYATSFCTRSGFWNMLIACNWSQNFPWFFWITKLALDSLELVLWSRKNLGSVLRSRTLNQHEFRNPYGPDWWFMSLQASWPQTEQSRYTCPILVNSQNRLLESDPPSQVEQVLRTVLSLSTVRITQITHEK